MINHAEPVISPLIHHGQLVILLLFFCGLHLVHQDCQLLDPKMNKSQVDLIFCDTRVKKKGPVVWQKRGGGANLMVRSVVVNNVVESG